MLEGANLLDHFHPFHRHGINPFSLCEAGNHYAARLAYHTCTTKWYWCNLLQHWFIMYSQSVKDKSNNLLPQSRSADKCSDPEVQRYGRTKPGRREHVLGNWSLTQWDVSVAVRITSKLHAAFPQKTWWGAAQDMSFRIQPAGEKKSQARCLQDSNENTQRANGDFY